MYHGLIVHRIVKCSIEDCHSEYVWVSDTSTPPTMQLWGGFVSLMRSRGWTGLGGNYVCPGHKKAMES